MSAIRDQIRAAVFNQTVKSKITKFAGVDIELRQPPVGEILGKKSDNAESDRKTMVSKMLIDYCFVPGTDEKVFDDADVEVLMAVPFNADWIAINKAIDSLTDLDGEIQEQAKN